MRRLDLVVLSFVFGLSACATKAKRPENVPQSAIFSGGIKGGSWLQCTQNVAMFKCDVYNYTGRLYESGDFKFATHIIPCYPSFIVSDYRINGGYMVPKNVKQVGTNLSILLKDEGYRLDDTLKDLFPNSNLQIQYSDDCKNGHYIALSPDGKKKSGRIWAGQFFQVFE